MLILKQNICLPQTALPLRGVATRMEDSEYDNDLVFNGEKNRVGEPFKQRPSYVRTELWILKGSVDDTTVCRAQFVEKF